MRGNNNIGLETEINYEQTFLTTTISILGAAVGAKIAGDLIRGSGLSSLLSQLGGALLGGYVGGKVVKSLNDEETK